MPYIRLTRDDTHFATVLRHQYRDEGFELIICFLGGTKSKCADSEDLVKRIAAALSEKLRERAVFVTCGMAGVQETFAKSCRQGCHLRNLLPDGENSGFGVGTDIHAGKDSKERRSVFGFLGDLYITVEGGSGVAKEALQAWNRGATVVPLIRTGGASSGKFGFPAKALIKPFFVTEAEWAALSDSTADLDASADAVVQIVLKYVAANAFKLDSEPGLCARAGSIVRSFLRRLHDETGSARGISQGRGTFRGRE